MHPLLPLLRRLGWAVSQKVTHALRTQASDHLASVYKIDQADTIYQIDRDVEDVIVPILDEEAAALGGIVLLAEGIGDEEHGMVLGAATAEAARWRLIMDPIDGTRGIMYDKRAAWCLMAAAPNHGPETHLAQADVALMMELPTTRAYLADCLWAVRGQGAHLVTINLFTGEETTGQVRPSRATDLLGGFGQLSRFFAPGRSVLARIEDELMARLYPKADVSRALAFEDQYICTGGQLYQVLTGRDRYVADVRGRLGLHLQAQGKPKVFVCHPYDVCTLLIGQEVGIEITDGYGNALDARMDLTSPVDFIFYANPTLRAHIEPVLLELLDVYLQR